ncbi:MAG: type I phosphomannose isomerase catalytic subunit [Planctomycetia bacterium]
MLEPSADAPFAFLVRPAYLPKPWGGRRLESLLGRRDLPAGPVGESWEVSTLLEAPSRVDGGPEDGRLLSEVLDAPLPLVIKLLDAREDLSVQVHPDGADGEPPAKEEAWVALADGGRVGLGLDAAVAAERPWPERLSHVDLRGPDDQGVRPPSLLHVPPGTVHALRAGCLVWEVQTPVEVTWRLDDYGRKGLDGKPRRLHLSEAAGVLARGPRPRGYADTTGRHLVGKRFRVDLYPPGTSRRGSARVAFMPQGGQVRGGGRGVLEVPPGRSVVLTDRVTSLRSSGWIFTAAPR